MRPKVRWSMQESFFGFKLNIDTLENESVFKKITTQMLIHLTVKCNEKISK